MQDPFWDRAVQDLADDITNSERRTHIWGTVETAMILADRHGIEISRVVWAALLHDCAKNIDKEEMHRLIEIHGLAQEPDDWNHPAVWHALVGSHRARERYGIRDEQILGAIRYHPTGTAGMGEVELAVYIADYVEPSREYPASRELRKMALNEPLLVAACNVCRSKIAHLHEKGRPFHPRSLRALADLEERMQRECASTMAGKEGPINS